MSTLEKAIGLLRQMPEQMIENVYTLMRAMSEPPVSHAADPAGTAFGIAHQYANESLIEQETGAFERAMVGKMNHLFSK